MKKLVAVVFAVALIGAIPREAAAEQSLSMSIGAVFPTILGASTGGLMGYYFVTGPVAVTVGSVLGGLVGNWWYTAGTAPVQRTKKALYSEILPLQPTGNEIARDVGLRTAAFSATAD